MIGIIVAMKEELDKLLKYLSNKEEINVKGINIYKGNINNRECVIALSGVGKVNAARTTQIIIDNYNIDKIINIGVSGSCSKDLNIGDIVIADRLYQYDFDITMFNHNIGYVPLVGDYITILDDNIKEFIDKVDYNINIGHLASADRFVSSIKDKLELNNKFNAIACDMESGAIGQVCYLSNVDFLIIRSISDTINDNITVEFEKYLDSSSEILADILIKYIEKCKK